MRSFSIFIMLSMLFAWGCSHKEKKKEASSVVTLTEAYIYGFPLVLMDITKETMTNVARPDSAKGMAPVNQFAHFKTFPDANFKTVVRPNLDTLYSMAFLDLSKSPQVVELPDTNGRYYLFPMLDGWSNVYSSPGKRTTGTKAQKLIVAGPKWKGEVPAGYSLIKSPTELTWMIGRIQTNSKQDARTTVAKLQEEIKLYPMDQIGKDYTPLPNAVDPKIQKIAPLEKLYALSTEEFFSRLNRLMLSNPPLPADKASIDRFAKFGIAPGAQFSMEAFREDERKSIQTIPQDVKLNFENNLTSIGREKNGWVMQNHAVGQYGTDYYLRALIAHYGFGANLEVDAIYPTTTVDVNGERLSGKRDYVLHFEKSELPQVKAFWSITLYGVDSYLVKNRLNRYSLGDRSKLKYNKDGSLDIYVQQNSPGADKESNWLPSPPGIFTLTARLYWPEPETLEDGYSFPPIRIQDSGKTISLFE